MSTFSNFQLQHFQQNVLIFRWQLHRHLYNKNRRRERKIMKKRSFTNSVETCRSSAKCLLRP